MNDLERTLPVVYLQAGEIHFSRQAVVVLIVLGSCLSVTMFHRKSAMSAVCHGLLPRCRAKQACIDGCAAGFRYVDCAIEKMLKLFAPHEANQRDIEIKIFGGADMFEGLQARRSAFSVGKLNIEAATEVLAREGLSIAAMDVGGTQGRKLYFYTGSGEVLLKKLQPTVILAGDGVGG